jgi:hypothetical protein
MGMARPRSCSGSEGTDGHLALARTVRRRRRRRTLARQNTTVARSALGSKDHRARGGADLGWTASAPYPLDGCGRGRGNRDQHRLGAAHLAGAWTAASSRASVQTVQGSAVRRQLRDIVGLYFNPPDRAIVLSVDEKSQIQALDRTHSGLPMKKGHAGTITHDYKRRGTTTSFAALDILTKPAHPLLNSDSRGVQVCGRRRQV